MANKIQESINEAINTIVNQRINALDLDKTVIGVIDSVVDSTRSIYKIKCNGGFFNARSLTNGAIYLPGMSVYVQIPQNDMTKEKLIISRATSLLSNEKIDVVVSAINNYSILGTNVAKANYNNADQGLAIRSYHNPIVETNFPETIEHRAKLLYAADYVGTNYDIDWETFNLYKENATALMIEAEFRTSLDAEQRRQYSGEYGLGINAVFQNDNYQYGETQGQIFDYFAADTKAQDEEEHILALSEKDSYIQQILSESTQVEFSDFIKQDGYLDQYIYEITDLISTYAENNKDKYVPIQEEINNTYILMLKELKLLSSYAAMLSAYNKWRELAVAAPEDKIVSLTLDSNHMTGTPFYFTSWTTQYSIFEMDLSKLKRIDSIVFYKNGFNLDEDKCVAGVNIGSGTEPKEDLFVRNLKIYALQPISATLGDYRLEIQSPDGLIFNSLEDESLTINAKLTKSYYEDLSTKASFRWFKKSKNVTNVSSDGYNQYGGIGWKYLNNKGNTEKFVTKANENTAYENVYKCVAKIDDTVVLSQEFIIYNKAKSSLLIIESDLGTKFSFDSGKPLLTCKIKQDNNEYQEFISGYKYYWAVVINGQRIFLTGEQIKLSLSNLIEAVEASRVRNIIRNVKFFNGDNEIDISTDLDKIDTASRIQYPISNLIEESVVIFECYVEQEKDGSYYDIGNASLSIQNAADALVGTYKLTIENGEQVFQYDEYGNAPNAKKLKSPQEIKPLICHLYNPAGLEVPNSNYTVNWIVPIEETMIITSSDLQPNPKDGLNDLSTDKQFVFDIAQIYNESYQNNQINCQVTYNDLIISQETNFYFGKIGSNGTNGTDMVLRILNTKSSTELKTQPLTLYRYKFESGQYQKIMFNDNSSDTIINTHIKAQLYQKNIAVEADSITWNIAGNTQTYTNKIGKFLELQDNAQTIEWKENYNTTGQNAFIIRAQAELSGKTYYAFYGLPVITYNSDILPTYTRIGINNKTLLKEVVYNADGRNPIYNHSQGVELINVPADYKIEWRVQSGNHSPDFLLLEERDKKNGVQYISSDKNLSRIYILPNDEYAGSHNDNIIVARITSDNTLVATVVVPIHMSLNTFGLASLNAWDGNSVTIDEDNGAVYAPQIGAGEKDNNNRFTGIVMGKTETYTGKSTNEKDIGLLGYAHGIQSIFLDAQTGEATFGLPEGYILDKSGNTPIPREGDDYGEGRIELRPGDVSKIGGWRLGRQSLYYTANTDGTFNGTIGDSYFKTDNLDTDAEHHIKDIPHNLQGILLSAVPAYISIKGRVLDAGDISESSDAQISPGDSLELQLDPNNTAMFAIYRHHNDKRELLSGINMKGQLIANRIEQAPAESASTRSSLGIESINAFSSDDGGYIGLNLEAGKASGLDTLTFFRIFIDKDDVANAKGTIHLTGGQFKNSSTQSSDKRNDYSRPIHVHGENIALYARDNNDNTTDHQLTQNVRLLLSNTQFYAGDTDASHIYLPASGAANITTIGSNTIKGAGLELKTSGNQNINLRTNNDNDNYSYLKLDADANASLLGATNLYGYARNGNVGLYARNNGTDSSWLTLVKSGAASLVGATSLGLTAKNGDFTASASASVNISGNGAQLYLPATSVGQASLLTAASALTVTTPGILTVNSKAGNSSNAVNISTDIGGVAIQKQSSYKKNAIYSGDLGLISRYGIFQDRIGTSGGNANNSVWADGRYITNSFGAEGYAFSNEDTITRDGYTIRGYNIQSLLEGILAHLHSEVEGVNSAIRSINTSINNLNNNKANASDLQNLANNYDNHRHTFTYDRGTVKDFGIVITSMSSESDPYTMITSKP